ncbi:NmrA/HSCARG family protein [Rubellimicrobium rubrum]|uniref:NmrA/HSCARG family protein n=1 Tax=Rubellimicrobium rubrum TaxID=2585369 RepID=A0A5C4MV02_9RHOB|nr:NmrA/HSCARG family protein [Rubellimicrobium rubrum]TNC49439.1 NmrA/HSCARG family protein [Rubellimicrobium rubrum]
MTRILLITGATGAQGGATLREMIRRKGGWDLRALVRNPAAAKAQALARQGVTLAKGDLDDEGSLRAALRGVYGVHSVQTPMGQGPEGEERQGKRLATLAAEAGVSHFVYSSVAGAERDSGVPHFASKWHIENHIRDLGLPATVLRPAVFMDNFGTLMFRTLMLSMFRRDVDRRRPIQLLDTADVGWFAAEAFDHPEDWIGREIELAGDELTWPEMVQSLRRSGHRPALPLPLPGSLVARMPEDFTLMVEWIGQEGFRADLPALRTLHPGLRRLGD